MKAFTVASQGAGSRCPARRTQRPARERSRLPTSDRWDCPDRGRRTRVRSAVVVRVAVVPMPGGARPGERLVGVAGDSPTALVFEAVVVFAEVLGVVGGSGALRPRFAMIEIAAAGGLAAAGEAAGAVAGG